MIELIKALVAAQGNFEPAVKTSSNPAFRSKYADLAEVIGATRPALLKNGLTIIQSPTTNVEAKTVTLASTMYHTSGESLFSALELPAVGLNGKFDVQTIGSAITYARRYAYMAMVGIAPEDDDGNTLGQNTETKVRQEVDRQIAQRPKVDASDFMDTAEQMRQQRAPQPVTPPPRSPSLISEAQRVRFHTIASKNKRSEEEIKAMLKQMGHEHSSELLRNEYDTACEWAGL